jgi:hypothetical protein
VQESTLHELISFIPVQIYTPAFINRDFSEWN